MGVGLQGIDLGFVVVIVVKNGEKVTRSKISRI